LIDDEVDRIVRTCYAQSVDLLTTHRPTLDRIAEELRRHETIDAKQLRNIMEETGAPIASTQSLPIPGAPPQRVVPMPPTTPVSPYQPSEGGM
jgi:cell division protease FtsH